MSFLQSIRNSMNKLSDAMEGRNKSLYDLYSDVVQYTETSIVQYLACKHSDIIKAEVDRIAGFLTQSLIYLVEAHFLLRIPSNLDIFLSEDTLRLGNVAWAMRKELMRRGLGADFHDALAKSLYPVRGYKFLSGSPECFIDCDVCEEYKVARDGADGKDHEGLEQYYKQFDKKFFDRAFRKLYDHFKVKMPYKKFESLVYNDWIQAYKKVDDYFRHTIINARMTDICKDFV